MSAMLLSNMNGEQNNEDRIFSLLFSEDELTWQTMIYELVKTEQMDPWDISVSVIAERFITTLKKMKEMDFRIGGKMVLAAALLLKIKSERLMKEDILALDNLISSIDAPEDFLDELSEDIIGRERVEHPALKARTPQPRQRKVSVYDLVEALEKALNVEKKKSFQHAQEQKQQTQIPKKGVDMSKIIGDVFSKVKFSLASTTTISFSQLIPSTSKEDMVYTFIPLLHLDTQRKIDLLQKEHFGEIKVKMNKYSTVVDE